MIARLLLTLTLVSSPVLADEIETDRPDQTETATTVPAGSVQIESGVVYESDAYESTFDIGPNVKFTETTIAMPTVLVRIGVVEGFELRFEETFQRLTLSNDAEATPGNSESWSGFTAPSIGIKAELMQENGWMPQVALIADVTLPLGLEQFRPTYIAPAFRFTAAHTLSETFSMAYNVGGEWDGQSAGGAGIYTFTIGVGVSEQIGSYLEVFGEMPAGGPPEHMIDGGLTFRPVPHIQFDASAGVGLNAAAADYYLSAGASIRLPN